MLDFDEHIGNLLTVLVSVRLFTFKTDEDVLPFITKASDRAPRLEYFAMQHTKDCYWKRIGGEWVICDSIAIL